MEDDREKQQEEKEAIEKELAAAKAAIQLAAEEERAAKDSLAAAQQKLTDMLDQVEPLNRDLSECEESIRRAKRDLDHYVAKKAEYANIAKEKSLVVQQKAEELEATLLRAKVEQHFTLWQLKDHFQKI